MNTAVWLKRGAVALAVLATATVIYFVDPSRANVLPPCLLHRLTGLYCPGCGATRALHQLAHGNLAAAWRLNPLLVSVLPVAGALLVHRPPVRVRPVFVWLLVAVLVMFAVLRNLPQYPFTLLQPQL